LKAVAPGLLPKGFSVVSADENGFAAHISRCYENEGVSADELRQYQNRRVYAPDLWIALSDQAGRIAASGIAELDASIKEGILEWIQVSPEYRRRGLGRFVVNTLLCRLQGRADFVTVSGRMDNRTNPLALYRSCGFKSPVIWHVLRRRHTACI
ncbi:MAG: GNAT family N-acetyltransferase, partial [Clostridia bacterium]|nr:GNAT family N-acetyltransferase [Clostridia bacterium]